MMRRIHPGEILREEFVKPMNINVFEMAFKAELDYTFLSNFIWNERGSLTKTTAEKIASYLNTDSKSWLNMQELYDNYYHKEVGR